MLQMMERFQFVGVTSPLGDILGTNRALAIIDHQEPRFYPQTS